MDLPVIPFSPPLVGGAAAAACFLSALIFAVFPGVAFRWPLKSRSDASFWAGVCVSVARTSTFAKASGIYDLLRFDSVEADGTLSARFRVTPAIANTMHSLHGGVAALVVDEVTTASIMARRCYPGVSVSMSLQYLNGCLPGDEVQVVSRVTRQGRILCHTDTTFYRVSDGAVMIRASHVKYVAPPSRLWGLLLAMRTSAARHVLPLAGIRAQPLGAASQSRAGEDAAPSAGAAAAAATAAAASKFGCEPFTDLEKKAYYRSLGTSELPLRFFDRCFEAAGLRALGVGGGGGGGGSDDDDDSSDRSERRFELADCASFCGNPSGNLHGAATAALVDVLGSSAIASHPDAGSGDSCGVATNLDVTFGAAGRGPITFATEVPKLGNRLATAVVVARDRKGRLVARGTVTKYGKLRGGVVSASSRSPRK